MEYPDTIKETGVKLTAEQIKAVKENMARPVMYLSGGIRMGGDESPADQVHRFALENGLPETEGFYGANLETGDILIYVEK